jgi:hypothetical protein
MRPRGDRTVAERMRGNDDALTKQSLQFARPSLHQALEKESLPPVLLALAGKGIFPWLAFELAAKAKDYQRTRRPESPPVRIWPKGVHSAALRAAPAFHPHRMNQIVEVSRDIAMSPQACPPASGTSRWPWPRVVFALTQ